MSKNTRKSQPCFPRLWNTQRRGGKLGFSATQAQPQRTVISTGSTSYSVHALEQVKTPLRRKAALGSFHQSSNSVTAMRAELAPLQTCWREDETSVLLFGQSRKQNPRISEQYTSSEEGPRL